MNCVFNDQIQFGFGDMLSIPQLDEIAFVDCEEGTVIEDVEPFLTENLQCACEQGTYWVSQNGFNCNQVNVMYCCSAAETPWEALAEFRGYHPDYLGSVEAVTDADGEVYQLGRRNLGEGGFFHNTICYSRAWFEPSSSLARLSPVSEATREGEPLQQQKAFLFNNFTSRFRFNLPAGRHGGKERDWETGNYYYGARYYNPKISVWLSIDPLAAKFNNLSPYHYTVNNPLNVIDYDGRDTLDVSLNDDGIWEIMSTICAEGDDVIRVTANGSTESYTYSHGEYGDRVAALNLEGNSEYTLGVYLVSNAASEDGGAGFYVLPGGKPSTKQRSNARLPDGQYELWGSYPGSRWVLPWVKDPNNSEVAARGIKWHPALSPSVNTWTDGCFANSSSYYLGGCLPKYSKSSSVRNNVNFNLLLGASTISDKKFGNYCRMTADFGHKRLKSFELKSAF